MLCWASDCLGNEELIPLCDGRTDLRETRHFRLQWLIKRKSPCFGQKFVQVKKDKFLHKPNHGKKFSEPVVKAYKYMTGIFSVTHTSEQQASDCDKQPTKMDVSLLEEQYDHIKQKQKLQSYIIVFKTDEHEPVLPESMISSVLINKTVRRSKSFTERVPVRKVSLELSSSGSVQDNSLWRTHLGIHRLVQTPSQGVTWDLSQCENRPYCFDNQRLISKGNSTLQHKELEGTCELSACSQLGSSGTLNAFGKENGSKISSTCQKPPLKSATSAVWTHQHIPSTKCMAACNKLNFYPFPNKKRPRISEAARKLGLYISQ